MPNFLSFSLSLVQRDLLISVDATCMALYGLHLEHYSIVI